MSSAAILLALVHAAVPLVRFEQLNASFGAVAHFAPGLQAHRLPADEVDAVMRALEEFQVLVFNFDRPLTMHEHVEFSKQFGSMLPPPPVDMSKEQALKLVSQSCEATFDSLWSPEDVSRQMATHNGECVRSVVRARASQLANDEPLEILKLTVSESDPIAFGEGWHTDQTYRKQPPFAAVLMGRKLPPVGLGNTHFISTMDAFDRLPSELRKRIEPMQALHALGTEDKTFLHPVAMLGPKDRRVLYVNSRFTKNIEGEDPQLLASLLEHIEEEGRSHAVQISWEPGQIVMWDQRTTQHTAVHDYKGYAREMHRIQLLEPHENK